MFTTAQAMLGASTQQHTRTHTHTQNLKVGRLLQQVSVEHHVGVYPSGQMSGGIMASGGITASAYRWLSDSAFLLSQWTSFRLTSRYVHGWWWAIAYTARMVLSTPHGEAEYTRCTALCSARITTMHGYLLAFATYAHARA